MSSEPINVSGQPTPLIIDLDGTLIKSDLLFESFFRCLGKKPAAAFQLFPELLKGRAQFKEALARLVEFDPALLPYDDTVLKLIAEARAAGRPVYLASASNRRLVSAVADHLGVFTGWFASDANTNMSGINKARILTETFGDLGYVYVGNGGADIHVWAAASKKIGIRTPSRIAKKLSAAGVEIMDSPNSTVAAWLRQLRIQQYAKNALVFVPMLTAHKFDPSSLIESVAAAVAFSLCASSVYIFNDLTDLAADRAHPTKKDRPLAAGAVPISTAIVVIPVLLLSALALAAAVSPRFLGVLSLYFMLSTAYTCWLKAKMLIDVVVLAMLYTLRVIGGAAAVGISISEWLLAFSMFLFLSLALIKRYSELCIRLDKALSDPENRNYKIGDLPVISSLAAAAGFNAVTVFALYVSSDAVRPLYRHPKLLWGICPLLIYWIGRALTMAHRRWMHDDPIVFALKDRVSLVTAICVVLIVLVAI